MQIQETLSRLDTLLHQCKLDEAEVCLTQAIAQAQAEQDMESEKLLRNEQIGFYRDCGKFPQALGTAAKARALFENAGDTHSISYATTLLNCANAYRAAGKYQDAFAAFETVQQLSMVFNKVGNSVCQYAGFAAARACKHEQRSFGSLNSFKLFFV